MAYNKPIQLLKSQSVGAIKKLLGCFHALFWVIIHLYFEAQSYHSCRIWLNLRRKYSSIYYRIRPATSISSHMNKHQWPQFHWQSYMLVPSDRCMLVPEPGRLFKRSLKIWSGLSVRELLVVCIFSVNTIFPTVSFDCRLWQWLCNLLECSWLD